MMRAKRIAATILSAGMLVTTAYAQTTKRTAPMEASGTFMVKIAPVEISDLGKDAAMGRMTIDKVFSGGIEGTSKGEMLTSSTAETTAMAYVAIEKVTAKLSGKQGTFVLSHQASMMAKDNSVGGFSVTVVPYSGTGELSGIDGTMTIDVVGSEHKYTFSYKLPQP